MCKSRYGWRWILVAFGGLSWISLGCSPQTLSVFMMPFTDNNVDPEYKIFVKDKEVTLAIVSNFSRPELDPELQAADVEFAEIVAAALRKRCADNKHKLKLVPTVQVRSEEAKQRQLVGGAISTVELGKTLKADFVLELTINSLTIREKGYVPPHYRGRAQIAVCLYKVDAKEGEHKVHEKELPRIYPREAVEASSTSPTSFRRLFLVKAANDVAKMFISYPPDEAHQIE